MARAVIHGDVGAITMHSTSRYRAKTSWCLIAVFSILVLTRVFAYYNRPVLPRDAVGFIRYAAEYESDPVAFLRHRVQEPLHPILLAYAKSAYSALTGDRGAQSWHRLAVVLGTLVSGATALALFTASYVVFRDIRIAFLTGGLLVVNAKLCVLSSSGMSEPTLGFLLSVAILLLVLSCTARSMPASMLLAWATGSVCAAMILTRKEGIIIPPTMLAFLALPQLRLKLGRRFSVATLLVVGFVIFCSAYWLVGGQFIWLTSWFDRSHDAVATVLASTGIMEAKTYRTAWDPWLAPLQRWIGLVTLPVAVSIVGYHWFYRRHRSARLAWLFALLLVSSFGSIWVHGFMRKFFVSRYLIPTVICGAPLAAASLVGVIDRIRSRPLGSWRRGLSRGVPAVIIAISLLPSVICIFTPRPVKEQNILQASEWLKAHSDPSARIFAFETRIAFYAERPLLHYNEVTFFREYDTKQDYRRADFIVFYDARGERWIRDLFFRTIQEHGLPAPQLVTTLSSPNAYPVEIYRR